MLSEDELVRLLAACEAKAATLAMTMRYAHLAEGHVRHAMNALRRFSTKSAHGGKIGEECGVSVHAPVAQVDRATVS